MPWVVVPAVAVALVLVAAGTQMVRGDAAARATASRLGIAVTPYRLVGALQLAAAAGLLAGLAWPPLGVAASAGLVLLMLGAATTHVRVEDPAAALLPALGCLVGAVVCLVQFLE